MSTDVDNLPPTQYLILDVLAARWRAGDQTWTFPSKMSAALDALGQHGLIGWKSGTAPHSCLAWLTEEGQRALLLDGYQSAGDREVERLRAELDAREREIHTLRSRADIQTATLENYHAVIEHLGAELRRHGLLEPGGENHG